MWLHASCFLEFNIPVPTPFVLMLRPRSGRQQWVAREQYVLSPSVSVVEFTDMFGNLCQRLVAPAGCFTISTSVDIETADAFDTSPGAPFVEVQQLPDETLPFLLPSRYCESDLFTEMAASIVKGRAAGYDQCTAIVEYIRGTVRYAPGAGQQIISASELNKLGRGVCRDMAHLGIACCRALSRLGWSLATLRRLNRWIFTPGSRPMSEINGTRSIQHNPVLRGDVSRLLLAVMRPTLPYTHNSAIRWAC